jgi:FtsP/CotA-like multicopper oxidase with cupredoxin domain
MRLDLLLASVAAFAAADFRVASSSVGTRRSDADERVVPNDNRVPAGVLREGVLTLRLEARLASWHPDGDSAPGALVPAFAEAGGPARIPGPLIRVPAGTEVEVVVANRLAGTTLDVFGLGERIALAEPPRPERVRLASGETRTVRFRLYAPGTYYYWGTTTDRPFGYRTHEDAQLTGAIVVDAPGTPVSDRVLVIGMWTDTVARAYTNRKRLLAVINGRAWPNTERFHYAIGDTARWRVINASADAHPMHLHGFYFEVDGRGTGTSDTLSLPGIRARSFTENLTIGGTMNMTWVPERAGNWLFHCHIPEHFAHRGPLGMAPEASATTHTGASHATDGMGGLVMGITVDASPADSKRPSASSRRRSMRLLVRRNVGGVDASPFLAFVLDRGVSPPPDSGLHYGSPIVLVRDEPVRITVVNTLAEPTSVHWHGIELESYFDGVAGFSGSGTRLAPLIAPGDSFVVRFTPPRAGTFIYHTHFDEERQLLAGLVGPLIVLEPGERYDPVVDRTVLITSPTSFAEQQRAVLVGANNGPGPFTLRAGVSHRVRFINMTVRRPRLLLQLMRGSTELPWHPVAKDALPVPSNRTSDAGLRQVAIGETLDVLMAPDTPGELRLDVRIGGPVDSPHPLLGSMPIRVLP